VKNNGVTPRTPIGWGVLQVQVWFYSLWLRAVNRWSRQPVTGDCDVDVSLTSFGRRIRSVWKTLETIGRGAERPRRIVLWLDDEDVVQNPPESLRRLMRRGLEIKHCADYGPHKKYFPYVMEKPPTRTLVTADDDMFYPRAWLAKLVAAHRAGEVTAYRARIRTDGSYGTWPMCTTNESSPQVFATGVSGVAYPPQLLTVLREQGDSFLSVCPRADDYWLHFAAAASDTPVRQVSDVAADWWPLRIAPSGLWIENVKKTANDSVCEPTERAWTRSANRVGHDVRG
jgi:hypothetical protein